MGRAADGNGLQGRRPVRRRGPPRPHRRPRRQRDLPEPDLRLDRQPSLPHLRLPPDRPAARRRGGVPAPARRRARARDPRRHRRRVQPLRPRVLPVPARPRDRRGVPVSRLVLPQPGVPRAGPVDPRLSRRRRARPRAVGRRPRGPRRVGDLPRPGLPGVVGPARATEAERPEPGGPRVPARRRGALDPVRGGRLAARRPRGPRGPRLLARVPAAHPGHRSRGLHPGRDLVPQGRGAARRPVRRDDELPVPDGRRLVRRRLPPRPGGGRPARLARGRGPAARRAGLRRVARAADDRARSRRGRGPVQPARQPRHAAPADAHGRRPGERRPRRAGAGDAARRTGRVLRRRDRHDGLDRPRRARGVPVGPAGDLGRLDPGLPARRLRAPPRAAGAARRVVHGSRGRRARWSPGCGRWTGWSRWSSSTTATRPRRSRVEAPELAGCPLQAVPLPGDDAPAAFVPASAAFDVSLPARTGRVFLGLA